MITNKAQNQRIALKYNLPAKMTAGEILAASMGAFANHRFTDERGFHLTSISEFGFQLRRGDRIENIKVATDPQAMARVFAVAPEFDPSW